MLAVAQSNPFELVCYRVRAALQAATYTVPQVRVSAVAQSNPFDELVCYRVKEALQAYTYSPIPQCCAVAQDNPIAWLASYCIWQVRCQIWDL